MKQQILYFFIAAFLFAACSKEGGDSNGFSDASSGQGGSLARFTIVMNHLYVVDEKKLYAYSLADKTNPVLTSKTDVGINVETLYGYEDKLFIGSSDAMYVYSISDAANPTKLGSASHVRSCDPVVANDSFAYVTVRDGNRCGGFTNELIVYRITNIMNPQRINGIGLESPWGLGMKGNRLYVCNGANGLVVYDISNRVNPTPVKTITGETFYDVIVTQDLLICMVEGGTSLYKLDATDELLKKAKIAN